MILLVWHLFELGNQLRCGLSINMSAGCMIKDESMFTIALSKRSREAETCRHAK